MEIFGVYTIQSVSWSQVEADSPSLTDLQVYAKRWSSHTCTHTHTRTDTHMQAQQGLCFHVIKVCPSLLFSVDTLSRTVSSATAGQQRSIYKRICQ